jgi:hypothetical protein
MRQYLAWFYSCIILHNLLATLGDQWTELAPEDQNLDPSDESSNDDQIPAATDEAFRSRLTHECVSFNYELGVLPF